MTVEFGWGRVAEDIVLKLVLVRPTGPNVGEMKIFRSESVEIEQTMKYKVTKSTGVREGNDWRLSVTYGMQENRGAVQGPLKEFERFASRGSRAAALPPAPPMSYEGEGYHAI